MLLLKGIPNSDFPRETGDCIRSDAASKVIVPDIKWVDIETPKKLVLESWDDVWEILR